MRPAQAGTGIVFRRTDLDPDLALIPARYDLVSATNLGTTLTNEHGVSITTTEHVMAALAGYGIDNAVVEVDGPEIPIMDGSSAPFVFLIECAGVKLLNEPVREIRVLKKVTAREGDKWAQLLPNEDYVVDIEIDFPGTLIGRQTISFNADQDSFVEDLGKARTFGFLKDVSLLRKHGYALGGSLDNSIVIDDERILNKTGLRYSNEFVRHKALDVIGDLALIGAHIQGRVKAFKPGHGLNNAILHALMSDPEAWEDVTPSRRSREVLTSDEPALAVNF